MTRVQRWAVAAPVLLGALDLTVVTAVLPAVVEELAIPLPGGFRLASWLVVGYLTAYAAAVVLGGVLADRYGVRTAFVAATGVFAFGSALVAVGAGAPTTWVGTLAFKLFGSRPDPAMVALGVLIAARCVQALGAGAVVPAAMAAVSTDEHRRLRNLGLIAGVDMAGWMLGHIYGGFIVQVADWRVIFWINVPLALLAIGLTRRRLPIQRSWSTDGWLGVVGGAMGLATVALGVMAPWRWEIRVALSLGGVLVLALLFDRLVPGELFRAEQYTVVANVLLGVLIFFVLAAVPLFVGTVVEPDTRQAALLTGLLLSTFTLPMAVAAPLGGRFADWSERFTAVGGGLMTVVGLAACRGWTTHTTSMVPGLVVAGIGLGVFLAMTADRLVRRAVDRPGRASGTVIVLRLIGMALGSALLTDWVLGQVDRLTGDLDAIRTGILTIFDEAFLFAAALALVLMVVSVVRPVPDAHR